MDYKTKALCIKISDYKERDKLLTLISDRFGKISAIAKSCTSPNSKLKLAASPLSFGEYILNFKGRYVVTGYTPTDNFFNSWTQIDKALSCQIILEILDKITFSRLDLSEELIISLKALASINYDKIYPYVVVIWFISKLMPLLGIDTNELNIPLKLKRFLESLQAMEVCNIDGLELETEDINIALGYLEVILNSYLSQKINSIREAIKLIDKNDKI